MLNKLLYSSNRSSFDLCRETIVGIATSLISVHAQISKRRAPTILSYHLYHAITYQSFGEQMCCSLVAGQIEVSCTSYHSISNLNLV